jgi:hypothetical protein
VVFNGFVRRECYNLQEVPTFNDHTFELDIERQVERLVNNVPWNSLHRRRTTTSLPQNDDTGWGSRSLFRSPWVHLVADWTVTHPALTTYFTLNLHHLLRSSLTIRQSVCKSLAAGKDLEALSLTKYKFYIRGPPKMHGLRMAKRTSIH